MIIIIIIIGVVIFFFFFTQMALLSAVLLDIWGGYVYARLEILNSETWI